MASVNKVILVGNLGSDPEIRSFASGGRIANLRIATSESWKDRNTGERQERTEWHSVSIQSDGLVGIAERYLRKGSKVYVEGQLRTRKWQDRDGNDRYSTEVVLSGPHAVIVMLDNAGGGQNGDGRGERRRGYDDRDSGRQGGGWGGQRGGGGGDGWTGGDSGTGGGGGWADDLDDDIPFVTRNSIW